MSIAKPWALKNLQQICLFPIPFLYPLPWQNLAQSTHLPAGADFSRVAQEAVHWQQTNSFSLGIMAAIRQNALENVCNLKFQNKLVTWTLRCRCSWSSLATGMVKRWTRTNTAGILSRHGFINGSRRCPKAPFPRSNGQKRWANGTIVLELEKLNPEIFILKTWQGHS